MTLIVITAIVVLLLLWSAHIAAEKMPALSLVFLALAIIFTIACGFSWKAYQHYEGRLNAEHNVSISKLKAIEIKQVRERFQSDEAYLEYLELTQ